MAETTRADAEKLGRTIQIRRVELGVKRPELAREAALSYPYLSEIENGIKYPSVKALGQIAAALDMSLHDLLVRAEQPSPGPHDAESADTWHIAASMPPSASVVPAARVSPAFANDNEPISERRIHEIVRTVVRAEIDAWARVELPALIKDELHRQLRDAED